MVKIVSYKERTKEDGSTFHVLEVQGSLEIVQSQSTGSYYATTKKSVYPDYFRSSDVSILCRKRDRGHYCKRGMRKLFVCRKRNRRGVDSESQVGVHTRKEGSCFAETRQF